MQEIINDFTPTAFASKLHGLRTEKGLTLKEVSVSCGIAVKRLYVCEYANVVPFPCEIRKLERFYGLEDGSLLSIAENNS